MTEDEEDVWLSHLSSNPFVKTLGANVYETFSQPPPAPAAADCQGWSDWLASGGGLNVQILWGWGSGSQSLK